MPIVVIAIGTHGIVRNTKDGVTSLIGEIAVKITRDGVSGDEASMPSTALVGYLAANGCQADALNDQNQTAQAYMGNLRSNITYMIQVLSPSRFRILKKVKASQIG